MNVGGIERPLRLLAGAWLFKQAMDGPRWDPKRLFLEVAAADLLVTALTGYCAINELIGRDSRHRAGLNAGIMQRSLGVRAHGRPGENP